MDKSNIPFVERVPEIFELSFENKANISFAKTAERLKVIGLSKNGP